MNANFKTEHLLLSFIYNDILKVPPCFIKYMYVL